MRFWIGIFVIYTLGCLSPVFAADKTRLAYAVICEDASLGKAIEAGIKQRLEKSDIEIGDTAPRAKLILYIMRDENSRINSQGITIAITHVSNIPVLAIAAQTVKDNKELSGLLIAMLREEGFVYHLSAAHLDSTSDSEIKILLDSVVKTFIQKNY